MHKRAPVYAISGVLEVPRLVRYLESWIQDGRIRQFSPRTIEERRNVIGKLLWFLEREGATELDPFALRGFLAHVSFGHEEPAGRWGKSRSPVRPRTAVAYYRVLRSLCNWLVEEGAIEDSPIGTLKPPRAADDQVQPFTEEQLAALERAAERTDSPRRDRAALLFLLDTGCRASEVCALRISDLDFTERSCRVRGKGDKYRTVYFGRECGRALLAYLRDGEREEAGPVFPSLRGLKPGEALTRSGLLQIVRRLGKEARVQGVRCSPHTFRHTFAVSFLRAGGNTFALQTMMGHVSLAMTRRYVALAGADLQAQHARFSPADNRKRRK